MVDQSIIEAIKKYLHVVQENGIKVKFGVLFGSQTSGKVHQWSDIDLVVISPLFDKQKTLENVTLLWKLTAHTDSRIEPIPCGEKQWVEDDSSAIIEIARRQGIQVSI